MFLLMPIFCIFLNLIFLQSIWWMHCKRREMIGKFTLNSFAKTLIKDKLAAEDIQIKSDKCANFKWLEFWQLTILSLQQVPRQVNGNWNIDIFMNWYFIYDLSQFLSDPLNINCSNIRVFYIFIQIFLKDQRPLLTPMVV